MDHEVFLAERRRIRERLAGTRSGAREKWESSKIFGILPMPWLSPAVRKIVELSVQRWAWNFVKPWPLKLAKKMFSRKAPAPQKSAA